MFINLNEHIIKLSDVSWIGPIDRHVIYHARTGETTFFLPVIVGGVKIEVKGKDKAHVEEMRKTLQEALDASR